MMKQRRLYADVDTDIPLDLGQGIDGPGQLLGLSVTLVEVESRHRVEKSLGNGITPREDGGFLLRLTRGDHIAPGRYRLTVRATDHSGLTRGIHPSPFELCFES